MQHLTIALSILAFGMGIASIMYVFRTYSRHAYVYIKTYLRYLIVLNISVFINLILHYLLTNVLSYLDTHRKVMLVIVVNIVGFYLFSLLTFLYMMLTRSLIGKEVGRIIRNLFLFYVIFASVAYGFVLALFSSSSEITAFYAVHMTCNSILSIISLVVSFRLFYEAGKSELKSRARILKIFSLAYAIFFLYQTFLWLLPLQTLLLFSTFNLFVLNFIPIPFISGLLKEQENEFSLSPETEDKVQAFYETYGLSKREREIANLILAGKSNEEIKNELYISIFTVKKHISNIFMKLDVSSRAQLIHRIIKGTVLDSIGVLGKDQ